MPPRAHLGSSSPGKAWQWQEKTKALRVERVKAAVRGEFDAVEAPEGGRGAAPAPGGLKLPPMWEGESVEAPSWEEFRLIGDVKGHVTERFKKRGVTEPAVCAQTVGTEAAGLKRWGDFVANGGLASYAKKRNDARFPHNVSRMR